MKKSILMSLALIAAHLTTFAHDAKPGETKPAPITTLVINANVNVVLLNTDKAGVEVIAVRPTMNLVNVQQSGDTLFIDAHKDRNFQGAGTIYVPATMLRNITVNSAASLRSLTTLDRPRLDILINGACSIAVSSVGQLNLIESRDFYFDHSRETRLVPASLMKN